MWLVCNIRAKILLSDPETSLTTPRLLPLRRSYGNYQSPQSSGSSRNILKRLGDQDDPDDHMETRLKFPINDEEFFVLSDIFEWKNTCFPYEDYSTFNLNDMTESEYLSVFRFGKRDILM